MPITETNSQYYAGAQGFRGNNALTAFTTTFDTDLVLGSVTSWNPLDAVSYTHLTLPTILLV